MSKLNHRFCMKCFSSHQLGEKCPKRERTWTPEELEKFRENPWAFSAKQKERNDLRNKHAKQTRQNKKYLLANEPYCASCGTSDDLKSLQLDHIINIASGGGFELENCQLLCPICHDMKTDREKSGKKRGRKRKPLYPDDSPMNEPFE